MIDWIETEKIFGFRNQTDLVAKRPKFILVCDGCSKRKEITVRVKSRIIDGQMGWRCPSCVCLGRSESISEQMKQCWADDEYRDNQLNQKAEGDYKEIQSTKSKERWLDDDYRSKIETGIDVDLYTDRSEQLYPGQFEYDRQSFSNWKNKIKIRCTRCNIDFDRIPLPHLQTGSCPACKLPGELRDFLPSGYTLNDRTSIAPLELDVHWSNEQLAIEYHGLYWHSYHRPESSIEKFRHQTKAIRCIDVGIRLYQFFDFEWQQKKPIIKSMLNNAFGNSKALGARKLTVTNLTNDASRAFFTSNHLQGHRVASVTLALCAGDDIIMAMSFAKCNDGYEIIRMATKLGYRVSGGASKLLCRFRRSYGGPIYTFSDLRYSTGNVYRALGFNQLLVTKPNYFYYRGNVIMSRQRCQKHRLVKLLSNFNESLSEPENMFANGYRRVWDAGHIKLMMK